MLFKFTTAFILLSLTVMINVTGLTMVLRRLHVAEVAASPRVWPASWLLIRLAAWVVAVHLIAISLCAWFFWWQNCLPDFMTAFYFSIITYTTVGYGDVVLTADWRLLAGVEALTGILMCGLSTGYFFTVVHRLYSHGAQDRT